MDLEKIFDRITVAGLAILALTCIAGMWSILTLGPESFVGLMLIPAALGATLLIVGLLGLIIIDID